MPTVALYQCSKCGTQYRPLDAGARRFWCCGLPLERVDAKRRKRSTPSEQDEHRSIVYVSAPAGSAHPPLEAIEVIPPRENTVDALAVQMLLNTFSTEESLFSLEIAGDDQALRLIVRGTPEDVAHIRRQLQATYDQVSFRTLSPEEDPARPSPSSVAVSAQLTLARPAYLPLRTYESGDFQEADPVRALLGAFDGMEAGERALSQIILFPAPREWSRRYEGSARQVEKTMSGEAMTMGLFLRQFVSVLAAMTAIGLGLWALLAYMRQDWLTFLFAGALFAGAVGGVMFLYQLFTEQANTDPNLVKEKITLPAYDAKLRLVAVATTRERASRKLREIVAAYRELNLQSGNSFTAQLAEFDPRVLSLDPPSLWKELTAHVMRLNTSELAALWHLPVGPAVPMLSRNLTRRILPLPATVSDGVLVGYARHRGQSVPVHLPRSTLAHHSFMVAKTQKGKSTLMAHLAAAAMEEDTALVVVDPHGDLARSLVSLVPRRRVDDVLYIDFSDTKQFVGLNLLDMRQGRSSDAIVSNIVHVGELIWSDNWGPRMEDALRMALRTLLAANQVLMRDRRPQFTLLDIPALFELPAFCRRIVDSFIRDSDIVQWWGGYFEGMYESLRLDVMNPVLTKIHRFSTHSVVRNIIGQSESTVNFRQLLDRRRILLVNTATGVIGPDAGGLLGAVLVDHINFAVREQMAIQNPAARARVVIVVDEFQSIPGVDYPGLLAELQKMGASFILATQALGQLDALDRKLRPAIMSNIETLFVFQTSAEDADVLRHELDDEVNVTDIINLSNHACYIKTQVESDRLPIMHVETLSPNAGDLRTAEQVIAQMTRYTRAGRIVEDERETFKNQMYGRELSMLRQGAKLHHLDDQGREKKEAPTPSDRRRTGRRSDKSNLSAPAENQDHPTTDRASSAPQGEADAAGTEKRDGLVPASSDAIEEPASEVTPSNPPATAQPDGSADGKTTGDQTDKDTKGENGGVTPSNAGDTLQVKVTRVEKTTAENPPEEDTPKAQGDSKRINP